MPRIRVTTPNYPLSHALAKALSDRGYADVVARVAPVERCSVAHRREVSFETISKALQAVEPFQIDSSDVSELDDGIDIDLSFGTSEPLSTWAVTVYTDSRELGSAVCARLNSFGFRVETVRYGAQDRSLLQYGGASGFARRLAAWSAASANVVCPEECAWSEEDKDIWLHVVDPAHAGKRPKEIFPVRLMTDDETGVESLVAALVTAGYERPCVEASFRATDDLPVRFRLDAGPLGDGRGGRDAGELASIVKLWLDGLGVDREAFPLEARGVSKSGRRPRASMPSDIRGMSSHEELEAKLLLPIKAFRSGAMRAYGGSARERFSIRIATDESARAEQCAEQLRQAGFSSVEICPLEEPFTTPCVKVGASSADSAPVVATIRSILSALPALADLPGIGKLPAASSGTNDSTIVLELPFLTVDRAERETRLAAAFSAIRFVIHCDNEADANASLGAFADLGLGSLRTNRRPPPSKMALKYGGASPAVIGAIAERLFSITGREPELCREWGDDDTDIFVDVPHRELALLTKFASERRATEARNLRVPRTNVVAAQRSFILSGKDTLHVGELRLEARGSSSPLVPAREEFETWCLDETTSRTIQHVAWSVNLGEPCLLEGPSGTSKTSSIRYLASLLGQPVMRLNLNGQTDAGELIGRFVPNTAEGSKSKRGTAAGWVWQDGPIPRALREGWWIILDELNLAEPQIVERLNPLLEECPSLVVTENDGMVFGSQGEAVHRSFRIFATMNPQDYAGRAAVSPAFLDRWRGYLVVTQATEQEHLAFLRCAVFGEQPAVVVDGKRYRGHTTRPTFALLEALPSIDKLLEQLARFHVAAESSAAAAGADGTPGAPSTVFTRRAPISVLRYLRFALQSKRQPCVDLVSSALHRYYFSRAGTVEQSDALHRLAEAAGLEGARRARAEGDAVREGGAATGTTGASA